MSKQTYAVTGWMTISIYTEVEAKSVAEAKRIAASRAVMSLCHQCASGEPAEEWVTSGELDGAPRGIAAERSASTPEAP